MSPRAGLAALCALALTAPALRAQSGAQSGAQVVAHSGAQSGAEARVAIERFTAGADGLPAGWTSSVGATSTPLAGPGTTSTVAVEDGALVLAGDAGTSTWRYLELPFAVRAGEHLRLDATVRLTGARVEGRQYENRFVGIELRDAAGRRLAREVRSVSPRGEWAREHCVTRAPEGTASGAVTVFLSHSGRLEVRELGVRTVAPAESYDLLVDAIARDYAHLALRGVEWPTLAAAHAERARAAADPAAFVAAIRPLLAELGDLHVWIRAPDGAVVGTHESAVVPNVDPAAVRARVEASFAEPGLALVGRTAEGYGYVGLGTFQVAPERFASVLAAVDALADAPGLVLDLRANGGGDERLALALVGRFTAEPVVYSRTRVRDGAAPEDLSPPRARALAPVGGRAGAGGSGRAGGSGGGASDARPLVALVGPGCVSSCECAAQMLAALPQAVLVGLPTRGASGNPQPVHLPNGVSVGFSRWVNEMPDGTPLEGRGVAPDVRVEPERPRAGEAAEGRPVDPTLEAGLAELERALAARER